MNEHDFQVAITVFAKQTMTRLADSLRLPMPPTQKKLGAYLAEQSIQALDLFRASGGANTLEFLALLTLVGEYNGSHLPSLFTGPMEIQA